MNSIKRLIVICLFVSIALACSGPAQNTAKSVSGDQLQQYLEDKPPELQPAYKQLLEEGERNEVLNQMRLGLDAIQLGYRQEAKESLDRALLGIERVYANNEQATRARSLWKEEGCKNFKGEPYERVMAYYYRGLLYAWDQDYQNARACFKGGMLQDVFAEEEQFQFDFALMLYLMGWSSIQIQDDYLASEAFAEFKKLRPNIPVPGADDNLLLLVETGKSPRKLSDGVGHYQLKFRRGRHFADKKVRYAVDGGTKSEACLIEDIYYQATTRGGRQFDHILNGKAAFKKQTRQAGDVLGEVGSGTIIASTAFGSAASEIQGVGAALGLASVVSQVASASARAEADTRYWDNLPDCVHAVSCRLPPGTHQIELEFMDASGAVLHQLNRTVDVEIPDNGRTLVWLRSQPQIYSAK
jgi:tetratricopeptide (TPR) repeat protein